MTRLPEERAEGGGGWYYRLKMTVVLVGKLELNI